VSCLGKLTDDVTEFVESWQENPLQGAPNWDKSLLNEPPCLTQSHESLEVWINTTGLLQCLVTLIGARIWLNALKESVNFLSSALERWIKMVAAAELPLSPPFPTTFLLYEFKLNS